MCRHKTITFTLFSLNTVFLCGCGRTVPCGIRHPYKTGPDNAGYPESTLSAKRFECGQRPLPRLFQINNRFRVVVAQINTRIAQDLTGSLPGVVDVLVRQSGQLGYISSHLCSSRIELQPLSNRIEHPKVRRSIRSAAPKLCGRHRSAWWRAECPHHRNRR